MPQFKLIEKQTVLRVSIVEADDIEHANEMLAEHEWDESDTGELLSTEYEVRKYAGSPNE